MNIFTILLFQTYFFMLDILSGFLPRFIINLVVAIIIIRGIYYPSTKKSDYLFTYIVISVIVFLLCYLLNNIELQLGFALGLFAIFGILRYRTITIPIKEMTYLFSIIGLAVINALTTKSYISGILFSNIAIIAIILILEYTFKNKQISTTKISYPFESFTLTNDEQLRQELEKQLQVSIKKIEIKAIHYTTKTADITIHYLQ